MPSLVLVISSSEFDPWARVCTGDRSAFVPRYSELFSSHLDRKKEASYQRFRTANQRIRSDGTGDSRAAGSSGGRPGRDGSVVSRGGKASTKRPSQQSSGASSVASTSSKGGSKKSKRQSGSKKN